MPHTLILGHRGASFDAPENTLRAFQIALDQGADGVELDVQVTSDGVPVVIHDPTLDRTTSGSGLVDLHTWAELQSARVGTHDPLSRLEDVAVWAAERNVFLNVELKAVGTARAVIDVLEGSGLLGRTVVSSFDANLVSEVGRVAPHSRRFLLSEVWGPAVQKQIETVGAQGLCLREDAAKPAALRAIEDGGLPLIVWTVDDLHRMRALMEAGVFAVITNRPGAAVEERRRLVGA